MKKFSFIGSVLLFAMVVTFLAVGCQKESATNEETTPAADSENIVATEAGTTAVTGLITRSHAEQMAAAFAKQHPSVVTTSVGYSTKNLIVYLTNMLIKQKADSVFVSFGVYDKNTAPNPAYIGRSTMFFEGKSKKSTRSGDIRTLDEGDDPSSEEGRYLNGGHMIP